MGTVLHNIKKNRRMMFTAVIYFILAIYFSGCNTVLVAAENNDNNADVFTESAIFERLSHFKDAGLVNHLNTVDEAMIANGIYRMFHRGEVGSADGYALWKNRLATEMVNNATKDLPPTEGPSHFVLTAHEELPKYFPSSPPEDDGYSCWGGSHNIDDIINAMYNWHRALCAQKEDAAWNGVYDPAYMPQQMALTTGFMCIVACDCNQRPTLSLEDFSTDADFAELARDTLCESIPWGEVDFHSVGSNTDALAALSAPLTDLPCNCEK